jgi:hypothetical protein
MGLAKRKHEYTAAELIDSLRTVHVAGADLRELVQLTQTLITEDLERRTDILKNGRDGASLPREVLRQGLVRQGECQCNAALRWTADA